ncbi:MAG: 1-acyl-sn-glycerol-3-phosphate acyltransferase [Candidatus Schekmanbacteria bacterium]|nr:MAG: 1-acyl-sn-glycerol-3-phosphate acyltransferase [Candidatus Schekmanbacteria bacterium]
MIEKGPPYSLLKAIGIPLFKIYFRLTFKGQENIPSDGGVIIASNHASFIDPLVIAAGIKRKVGFIIIDTYYNKPLIKWFCKSTECIPVSEEMEGAGSMKQAIKYLKRGNVLCIFPEGGRTRDGQLLPAKSGVGILALLTGATVIPTVVKGSFQAYAPHHRFPRPKRIEVIFGKGLNFAQKEGISKKEQAKEVTDIIMEKIKSLCR